MRAHVAMLVAVVSSAWASTASAQPDDCPPGSIPKSEGSAQWCEPSVCDSDAQCRAGEVCKPMPLCVQIGTIVPAGATTARATGERLVATHRCGADKRCPDTTTCSEKSRCISRAQADKMGLLAPSASTASPEPAKKSCGCRVPGGSSEGSIGIVLALAGGSLAIQMRRRRRAG
ncbi:MAG: hypothetical protein KF819_17665 [Labilithrix sp.]|nr:hypothetical protein [Labilithrix sp.]